jgi:DHA1 family bicyclomycin/chloramphenicol resistance-like MFS transporter
VGVVSQLNVVLIRKLTARKALTIGLLGTFTMGLVLNILVASLGQPNIKLFIAVLFLTLAFIPMISANSTALAMSASGHFAGTASSLVGVSQFIMAGLVSFSIGFFHDGTIWPLASTIIVCALGALALLLAEKIQANRV